MSEPVKMRHIDVIKTDNGDNFSFSTLDYSVIGFGLMVNDRYVEAHLDDFDLDELISKLKGMRRHVRGSRLAKRRKQVEALRAAYYEAKAESERLSQEILKLDRWVRDAMIALDEAIDKEVEKNGN